MIIPLVVFVPYSSQYCTCRSCDSTRAALADTLTVQLQEQPRMTIADQSQIMLWLPGILVAAAMCTVIYRAFKYS